MILPSPPPSPSLGQPGPDPEVPASTAATSAQTASAVRARPPRGPGTPRGFPLLSRKWRKERERGRGQDRTNNHASIYRPDVVKSGCEVLHPGPDGAEGFQHLIQVLLTGVVPLLLSLQPLFPLHFQVTDKRSNSRDWFSHSFSHILLHLPGKLSFSGVFYIFQFFGQELLLLPELLQHLLVVFFELQQMLVRFLLDGEALQYLLRMNRLAAESPGHNSPPS